MSFICSSAQLLEASGGGPQRNSAKGHVGEGGDVVLGARQYGGGARTQALLLHRGWTLTRPARTLNATVLAWALPSLDSACMQDRDPCVCV